jgi:hypothetical protein
LRYEGLWPWTVHGLATSYEYLLIGDTTAAVLGSPPGTRSGTIGWVGGYAAFEECVAANLAMPPTEIIFAGGRLGIWNNDFKVDDNVAGENGRNPTWRLEYLCP